MKKKIIFNAFKVIKEMTQAELKKYNIELIPSDGINDHDLLIKILAEIKSIKSDVAELKSDVKSINSRIDNLVIKNNLVE